MKVHIKGEEVEMAPCYIIAFLEAVTRPMVMGRINEDEIPRHDNELNHFIACELEELGLIRVAEGGKLEETEKGAKWVRMLCDTPLPVQRWIDPREEKQP